jgi:GH35 family endo-1,4-beta-xylanase
MLLLFFCLPPSVCQNPAEENDSRQKEEWQKEAQTRIEQHRKENVRIVVKKNGEKMSNATVEMKMLNHEFLFGCNLFGQGKNEIYDKRFAELFNFATLPFYWSSYETVKDKPNYDSSDKHAAWCAENGIRTKGHPIMYNSNEPKWLNKYHWEEVFQKAQEREYTITERFKERIDTWDVINELVEWHHDWHRKAAPNLTGLVDHIDKAELAKACFLSARKGNPNAVLIVNDNTPEESYVEILNKMKDDSGNPVFDVVGMQSHMHTGPSHLGLWSNDKLWNTCELLGQFGKPVHFTELTVISSLTEKNWDADQVREPSTPEGEKKQQEEVERIYTLLFSHPAVEAITWWDFSDKGCWRYAPGGLIRDDMTPKPAYNALKKLIKEKWATNEVLITDASGAANIRAFRGKYRLVITLQNGSQQVFTEVVKKGKSELELNLQ